MSFNRRFAFSLLGAAATLPVLHGATGRALAQTGTAPTPSSPPPGPGTIADRLAADSRFERFRTLSNSAGLTGRYTGTVPHTVFAPTDTAFNLLPGNLLQALTGTTGGSQSGGAPDERAGAVLTQHVAAQTYPSSSFAGKVSEISTLNGGKLRIDGTQSPMTIEVLSVAGVLSGPGANAQGMAKIITADIMASNGVIHAIDGVLVP